MEAKDRLCKRGDYPVLGNDGEFRKAFLMQSISTSTEATLVKCFVRIPYVKGEEEPQEAEMALALLKELEAAGVLERNDREFTSGPHKGCCRKEILLYALRDIRDYQ